MAQVIATSFLRMICDKLGNKVIEEFGTLLGVDKELKKLKNTLSVIQDVLEDAEQKQDKERALKNWLYKLKDLAFDMDDLLDEVSAKALKRKGKVISGIKDKVRNLTLMPNSILFRSKIGHRIKEITMKLDEVVEQRLKFHLREGRTDNDKPENSSVREPTGSFVDETEVYGREEEKDKIIEFLVSNSNDSELGVIPIVGMGGLGKTTLAQSVYNDERVEKHFDTRIWICVSDDFDSRRLAKSIIESVTEEKFKIKDMDVMQRSLRKELQGKRFLLVLDDVWNENFERWNSLRILLSRCGVGSKVIVTTRSKRVASVMGTVEPLCLAGLSVEDCWLLFKRRAFEQDPVEHHSSLVEIGKEIVKKCGGVPLAAKALGSLLRFKKSATEWVSIRDSEIWRCDEEDSIFAALKLSYDHLPSHLKQCFAYCSIFPKGEGIYIRTLARLWIAEGFVWSRDSKMNLDDLGNRYVDELLSRSLLEHGDFGGQVKLHDLVYELAQFVSNDAFSVVYAGSSGDSGKTLSRYLGFHYDRCTSIDDVLKCGRKLRSVYALVTENFNEVLDGDQKLIDALFLSLKLLRSLHLSQFPMRTVPDSVSKLIHMRYLNLSRTNIEELPLCISRLSNLLILDLSRTNLQTLPESIGDLVNLSILNLFRCTVLKSLPSSMGRLRNLLDLDVSHVPIEALPESICALTSLQRLNLFGCYWLQKLPDNTKDMKSLVHLGTSECYKLAFFPTGMGELSQLRTLPFYVISDDEKHSGLAELNALNLTGILYIKNLEKVRRASDAKQANLEKKQGLNSLTLEWNFSIAEALPMRSRRDIDYTNEPLGLIETAVAEETADEITSEEEVFECLLPPENLRILNVVGYWGEKLPGWMMKLRFPNIRELKLDSLIECRRLPALTHLTTLKVLKLSGLLYVDRLPALGQLPCLRVLTLYFLLCIKCLGSEFYGGDIAFPALEELELGMLPRLEEWSKPHQEFFPRLRKLSLYGCPNLKALPSVFDSISELDMNANDKLLLSYIENGAFQNVSTLSIHNFVEDGDEKGDHPLPEVLSDRMDTLQNYVVRNTSNAGSSCCAKSSLKSRTTFLPILL